MVDILLETPPARLARGGTRKFRRGIAKLLRIAKLRS
jgi:hypothetical protein